MRALVVEDDPDVGPDVARALQAVGFAVDLVASGDEGWFRGDVEDFALAILDLGLPRLDGLSVLRRWRESGRSHPVLVLSARAAWTEKVEGIESGADDYLSKPFEMGELISRARALVRRSAGHSQPRLDFGRLQIDTRRMIALVEGRPVELSQLEFRLLNYLAHQPGRAVPSGEIAEHLYGAEEPGDGNAIEALVLRVRRKIGAQRIVTRRGVGYQLVPDPA